MMTMKSLTVLSLVLVAIAVLTACGGASTETTPTPEVAVDDSVDISWSANDDPTSVIEDFDNADIPFDTVDPDGNLIDSTDVSDCSLLNVDPAGPYTTSDVVTIELDCRQRDWDNQDGDVWDEFASAYATGFDDGCSTVFAQLSPDGSLYVDGYEYSDLDCAIGSEFDAASATDLPSEVPDAPDEVGAELGSYDGCVSIFDDAGGYLSYGNEEYDSSFCGVA